MNALQAVQALEPTAYAAQFRQLVHEHARPLARTLRYLGVSDADLEDAVQEVFVTAHRRWPELSHEESVGGWLRGVAVNVARNRRRNAERARRTFVPEVEEAADARLPEEELAERQRCLRLLRLLDALPEEQRTALVLFEVEGVPMKEISELLGTSLPTAYRRVEDAREALKRAMTKEER